MDATSIITQVSRSGEDLNGYFAPPEKESLPRRNKNINNNDKLLHDAPNGGTHTICHNNNNNNTIISSGNSNNNSVINTHGDNKDKKGGSGSRKKNSLLRMLLCCLGRGSNQNQEQNKQKKKKKRDPCLEQYDGAGTRCLSYITDTRAYLLPALRHQDVRKKCMVIDLDETLVHSSFKPINNADFIVPVEIDGQFHQVYVLKRPHVDEFLKRMGELYECILFTASLAKYADPVADLLDQWSVFQARLFRESCVFYRGNYVKDLNKLGRELGQIVIVDNSPSSYIFHPDNAVPVASWFDDMADSELLDLIPFFEKLSQMENVYKVLCTTNHPYNSTTSCSLSVQRSPPPPPPPPQSNGTTAITTTATSNNLSQLTST